MKSSNPGRGRGARRLVAGLAALALLALAPAASASVIYDLTSAAISNLGSDVVFAGDKAGLEVKVNATGTVMFATTGVSGSPNGVGCQGDGAGLRCGIDTTNNNVEMMTFEFNKKVDLLRSITFVTNPSDSMSVVDLFMDGLTTPVANDYTINNGLNDLTGLNLTGTLLKVRAQSTDSSWQISEIEAKPVPEPSAAFLFGAGSAVSGLALRRRRA